MRRRLCGADRGRRGAEHRSGRGGRNRTRDGSRRRRPLDRAGRAARRRGAHHRGGPGGGAARGGAALRRHRRPRPAVVDVAWRGDGAHRRRRGLRLRRRRPRRPGADGACGDAATAAPTVVRRRGADGRGDHDRAGGAVHADREEAPRLLRSGSCNSVREIPRLVALWQAGRLDLEGLVTRGDRSPRSTRGWQTCARGAASGRC